MSFQDVLKKAMKGKQMPKGKSNLPRPAAGRPPFPTGGKGMPPMPVRGDGGKMPPTPARGKEKGRK